MELLPVSPADTTMTVSAVYADTVHEVFRSTLRRNLSHY